MSNVGNKYKVGVLVLISFVCLVISLLSLGVMKYFKKTYEFMTVVESSVQGLEKGAKVKFKGVTIGEVSNIQITPQEDFIYIFMKFDPHAFIKKSSEQAFTQALKEQGEEAFRKNMMKGVENGMRCQLQLAGITGALFVDISYYDPKIHPISKERYPLPSNHPPYLPSIPSVSITNIIEEVQKSVIKIGNVDFAKISKQIDEFLATANTLIQDKSIKETIIEIKQISKNIQELTTTLKTTVTKKKMDKIANKLNKTLDDINKLVNNTNNQINEAKIPAATKSAKEFLDQGTVSFKKVTKLEKDVKKSLKQLNETLYSLKELVSYLEKNPSSLLRGKAEKPVVAP